jgi:hypothetical protein
MRCAACFDFLSKALAKGHAKLIFQQRPAGHIMALFRCWGTEGAVVPHSQSPFAPIHEYRKESQSNRQAE